MKEIIDTHVHLEEIVELDKVLSEAKQVGVNSIIAVGSDYKSNKKIVDIVKEIKILKIYPALGVHPSNINLEEIEITTKFIEENIHNIVGIGEIGLDYWWYKSGKIDKNVISIQQQVFEIQLDLAKRYSKPVIIHSRGAWEECYKTVKHKNINTAVFHWYSGPVEILKNIIQDGYFISATPAIEYSDYHRQAIEETPIEYILVETDSPVRYKTQLGETYISQPKDIIRTLTALSSIKKLSFDETVEITTSNAKKFFSL